MSNLPFELDSFNFTGTESFLQTEQTEILAEPDEEEPEFGSEEEAENRFAAGEDEEEEEYSKALMEVDPFMHQREAEEDDNEDDEKEETLNMKHARGEEDVEEFLKKKFLKSLNKVQQQAIRPVYKLSDLYKKDTRKRPSLLQSIRELEEELELPMRSTHSFKSAEDLNQYVEFLDNEWIRRFEPHD